MILPIGKCMLIFFLHKKQINRAFVIIPSLQFFSLVKKRSNFATRSPIGPRTKQPIGALTASVSSMKQGTAGHYLWKATH